MVRALRALFLSVLAVYADRIPWCDSNPTIRHLRNNAALAFRHHSEPIPSLMLQMINRAQKHLAASAHQRNVVHRCSREAPTRRYVDDRSRVAPILWTFPGSGNTFLRTLIEAATGVLSGSVFNDKAIAEHMPGETGPVKTAAECSRYSVIKAHSNMMPGALGLDDSCGIAWFERCSGKIDKCIMLVRHPFSAGWAWVQFGFFRGHNATAPYNPRGSLLFDHNEEWFARWKVAAPRVAANWAGMWQRGTLQYQDWIDSRGQASFIVLRFEDLVSPYTRALELRRVVDFADLTPYATDTSIACAFSNNLAELFHRKHATAVPLNGHNLAANEHDVWDVSYESPASYTAWRALGDETRLRAWDTVKFAAEPLGYALHPNNSCCS